MKLRHSHYTIILLFAIFILFQCIDVIDLKPDLTVASISFTPYNPTIEDSITFIIIVKNRGLESSPESVLSIRNGNDKKEIPVPMLSIGDTALITYTLFFDTVRSLQSTGRIIDSLAYTYDSTAQLKKEEQFNEKSELVHTIEYTWGEIVGIISHRFIRNNRGIDISFNNRVITITNKLKSSAPAILSLYDFSSQHLFHKCLTHQRNRI